MVKQHTKVDQTARRCDRPAASSTQEAPIHVSNVMLVDEATKQAQPGRLPQRSPAPRDGRRTQARKVRLSQAEREGHLMTTTTTKRPQGTGQRSRPRLKHALPRRDRPAAARRVRLRQRHAGARSVTKIVVNMGVGEAARDSKLIEGAIRDLAAITGQKPAVTKARKSIAQFKLREGMPIGAHATLRGDRMWEFLDRLLTIALPRIRDFRGLSPRQFDGKGNYTFGLTEQVMFHEIDPDRRSTGRAAWTSRS